MIVNGRTLQQTLQSVWGFDSLREAQVPIIDSVVNGRDSLSILKTSGGKSLCYQLPTLHRGGMTLVISPLISLMKDQVDALERINVSATYVNSSIESALVRARYNGLAKGQFKLFYVAPERFLDQGFMEALAQSPIDMIAIDEAHCASQWGHDFRPQYSKLGRAIDELESLLGRRLQRVAFTATATAKVQADIVNILGLRSPDIHLQDFDRENLTYAVVSADRDRAPEVEKAIREHSGDCIIVYCVTVKEVERIHAHLLGSGIKAGKYHGKLSPEMKSSIQEDFIAGNTKILVSTSAFGMGVDKADIRVVIHAQMPGSLEAWYQEAGRAGRDGKPAKAILFYNPGDRSIHQFFIGMASPQVKAITAIKSLVHSRLISGPDVLDSRWLASICREDVSSSQVDSILSMMVGQGELSRRENVFALDQFDPDENYIWVDEIRRNNWQKVNAMQAWAETTLCRRWTVLKYFGLKEAHTRCGTCDTCLSESFSKSQTDASQRYIRPITLINLANCLDKLAKCSSKNWLKVLLGMIPTSSLKEGEVEVAGRFMNYAVGDMERWREMLVKESLVSAENEMTERGTSWVKGRIELSLTSFSRAPEKAQDEIDPELLQKLKKWRKVVANREDMPEFSVFNEVRLQLLATLKTIDDKVLEEIGFTQAWRNKHGDLLKKVYLQHEEQSLAP